MIEQHYYDSFSVARDDHLGPRPPWCAGRHLTLRIVRANRPEHSAYYVYILSGVLAASQDTTGVFVKVRITYPRGPARLVLEDAFMADVFRRLVRAED